MTKGELPGEKWCAVTDPSLARDEGTGTKRSKGSRHKTQQRGPMHY
jgi:hypothetical protein